MYRTTNFGNISLPLEINNRNEFDFEDMAREILNYQNENREIHFGNENYSFFEIIPNEQDMPERVKSVIKNINDIPINMYKKISKPLNNLCGFCFDNFVETDIV